MRNLKQELAAGKALITDGAMGTMLQASGLLPGECPELWNLSNPDKLRAIHRAYKDAGSDIVKTNSFGGSRYKLGMFGLEAQAYEINRAAAALAREIAGDSQFVLGCIGPTGEFMEPYGDETEEAIIAAFAEQARALRDGGADAVTIETMSAIEECVAGIKAAKTVSGLAVFASFTFERQVAGGYASMMGVKPADFAKAAAAAGADAIGANCGEGAEQMLEIIAEIRSAVPNIPLVTMPNAGLPVLENGVTTFPGTPSQFAIDEIRLRKVGATILGGCCGSTPDHIRAAAEAIRRA